MKTPEAESVRVHILEKNGVSRIAVGKTDLRGAFSCNEKEDVQELFDTVVLGVRDLKS